MKRFLLAVLTAVPVLGICPAATAKPVLIPPVSFSRIYFDSPGPDNRSNTSLNAEWVRLTNNTTKAIQLTGWTVRDAANHVYLFPATDRLGAAKSVVIHTGRGPDGSGPDGKPDSTQRYWQSGNYIWNNTGDTATLKNATGGTVDICAFKIGVVINC